jgi:hypothetical protein
VTGKQPSGPRGNASVSEPVTARGQGASASARDLLRSLPSTGLTQRPFPFATVKETDTRRENTARTNTAPDLHSHRGTSLPTSVRQASARSSSRQTLTRSASKSNRDVLRSGFDNPHINRPPSSSSDDDSSAGGVEDVVAYPIESKSQSTSRVEKNNASGRCVHSTHAMHVPAGYSALLFRHGAPHDIDMRSLLAGDASVQAGASANGSGIGPLQFSPLRLDLPVVASRITGDTSLSASENVQRTISLKGRQLTGDVDAVLHFKAEIPQH